MLNWFIGLFHIHDWEPWGEIYRESIDYISPGANYGKGNYTLTFEKQRRICKTCGEVAKRKVK